MIIICKDCHIELSKGLTELPDLSLLNENDGEDFLPAGHYFTSDGEFFTGSEKKIIINLKDLINTSNHLDLKRLNGCCGLDGMDGLNKICGNGHEIGTAKEDCWMPHCIILEPDLIETK